MLCGGQLEGEETGVCVRGGAGESVKETLRGWRWRVGVESEDET